MKSLHAAAAAAILGLAISPALAQDMPHKVQFDVDDSGSVTMESFTKGFDEGGYYDAWDTDKDGTLSREEFNAGVYAHYDSDQDGVWNPDELATMSNDAIWSGQEKDGTSN